MNKRNIKAYVAFGLTALTIYLAVHFMLKIGWIATLPSFTLPIILFFLFLTALIYRYLSKVSTYGSSSEVQFYLASIFLKLLLGCGLLWALMIVDKPNATANAVLLLVSYGLFTAVEIIQLMAMKKA